MNGSWKKYASRLAGALFLLALLPQASSAATPWSFIVTGDSRGTDNGVNTAILTEMADEIVSQGVDFVLFPGDLVTGSSNPATLTSQLTTWRSTMQPVYGAGIGVWVCRGNHDDDSVTAWNNVFSDLPDNGPVGEVNMTYFVPHKNAFIVALDEYVTSHRVNQAWLDDQLAANANPHVFIFGHEPAFEVRHTDCLDNYPADRDAFWASIAGAAGRTYFCGHDHFYDHARIDDGDGDPDNDVHQYVVGTAGAPLYDWSGNYDGENSLYSPENVHHEKQHGYVLAVIDGLEVTLTWMQRDDTAGVTYVAAEQWRYTAVPEPATLSLLAVGVLALLKRKS